MKRFSLPIRSILLRLLARLGLALPVALVCAAVFELWQGAGVAYYLRGLLFVVPLALSFIAVQHLAALWQFALVSLGLAGLSWLLLGHPGGAVLCLLCCLLRGRARVFEEPQPLLLETPTLWPELVCAAVFLTGAFLRRPVLEKLALLTAALLLLAVLAYQGLSRLDRYLSLNEEISGFPARRITRWAGGGLLAVLILVGALLMPAVLSARGDLTLDLPKKTPLPSAAIDVDLTDPAPASGAAALGEIFGGQEVREFHGEYLFILVAVLAGILGALAVIRLLRQFRGAFRDSRDTVQYLSREEGEEQQEKVFRRRKLSVLDRSPNGAIRRQYRRQIRLGLGQAPARWQTPAEMEEDAGVASPVLHELYEKARYGPAPCTLQDLRRLKGREGPQRKA